MIVGVSVRRQRGAADVARSAKRHARRAQHARRRRMQRAGSYLLDEGEQGPLDGARFDPREIKFGEAGGRHGWRLARVRLRVCARTVRAPPLAERAPSRGAPARSAARCTRQIACLVLTRTLAGFKNYGFTRFTLF